MENEKIKVLFIASGNSKNFDIAPFIKIQGESLKNIGVHVDYFPVIGKGLWGYVKSGLKLRKYLKNNRYDVLHAHYSLSGWTAVIGKRKHPVVLSLMGSDAYGDYIGYNKIKLSSCFSIFLTLLIQPFVDSIICKSENIQKYVYLKYKSTIIPNGIDLEKFNIINDTGFDDVSKKNKYYFLVINIIKEKIIR